MTVDNVKAALVEAFGDQVLKDAKVNDLHKKFGGSVEDYFTALKEAWAAKFNPNVENQIRTRAAELAGKQHKLGDQVINPAVANKPTNPDAVNAPMGVNKAGLVGASSQPAAKGFGGVETLPGNSGTSTGPTGPTTP